MSHEEIKASHEFMEQQEFDDLARADEFSDGPWIDSFGDGDGEPYNPNRMLWGTLKDGRKVRSLKEAK